MDSDDAAQVFGDYRLVAPLAKGGMAELFVAQHAANGTKVVVKRLLPELQHRADIVDLFLTEADVGTLLRHENVVAVLDAGEVNGQYFLAMEYVDGVDAERILADAWQRQVLVPPPVAIRIAIDALRGLHAAHTLRSPQGNAFQLVHRDVSPDNLFVTAEGLTKVADFGIAKLGSLEGRTQSGLIKGKLTYMSPEQVQGKALDARADAFSLALVLFELLTNERPFGPRPGEGEIETVLRVRDGRVPAVRRHCPTLPRQTARVLDKALRAMRLFRFRDCGAFADALEQAALAEGGLARHVEVAAYVARVREPPPSAATASQLAVHPPHWRGSAS